MSVQINFRDDPELYDMLKRYKNSVGWTWERLILIGIAETIAKNKDNPDMVVRIADYLERQR